MQTQSCRPSCTLHLLTSGLLRMLHASFVQSYIQNRGGVKNGSSVTHAASGRTRVVQEHRPETLIVLMICSGNRKL